MPISKFKALTFDMYGTLVDVGAVAETCREFAEDPVSFNTLWRSKQLEYSFLRTLMGHYADFWQITEEALVHAAQVHHLGLTAQDKERLMNAWLNPTAYAEVASALPELGKAYSLHVLSNGAPTIWNGGSRERA